MKHSFSVVVLLLLFSLVLTSCSRKIVGARVHRRDRNCGCELVVPESEQENSICERAL